MEILEGRFKVITGTDEQKTLLFDTDFANECCDFFLRSNIKRISLYPGVYNGKDLKPLLPIKTQIEGILLGVEIDYTILDNFKNLKYISLCDNKKDFIDLSNFTQLETLICNITNKLTGLEKCDKLRTLFLNSYKPKSKDLSLLPSLISLKQLGIFQSNLVSLNGIEHFENLNKLQLYGLSKLEKIEALKILSDNLTEIEIEKCKNIVDYESIGELINLQKIRITESGVINSLSFISSLSNLNFISFWGTNIIDGNLAYCDRINYVGFDNKRHYNRKIGDFRNRK
jgi:hypothetical protein